LTDTRLFYSQAAFRSNFIGESSRTQVFNDKAADLFLRKNVHFGLIVELKNLELENPNSQNTYSYKIDVNNWSTMRQTYFLAQVAGVHAFKLKHVNDSMRSSGK
jgi:hypothetical protein